MICSHFSFYLLRVEKRMTSNTPNTLQKESFWTYFEKSLSGWTILNATSLQCVTVPCFDPKRDDFCVTEPKVLYCINHLSFLQERQSNNEASYLSVYIATAEE